MYLFKRNDEARCKKKRYTLVKRIILLVMLACLYNHSLAQEAIFRDHIKAVRFHMYGDQLSGIQAEQRRSART